MASPFGIASNFADRVRTIGGPNGITPPLTPTNGRSPSASTRSSRQHGSDELPRDVFGREAPYRNPEAPSTPRRNRSPGDDDDRAQDRAHDRAQWRQRRGSQSQQPPSQTGQTESDHPVGLGFRITAIEQTLREHMNELQLQRQEINDLKNMRQTLEARSDASFTDINNRVAGLDKNHNLARDGIRNEALSLIQALSSIMDRAEHDFRQLLQNAQIPKPSPPPGFASTEPSAPTAPTSVPPTWNTTTSTSPLSASTPSPWANQNAFGQNPTGGHSRVLPPEPMGNNLALPQRRLRPPLADGRPVSAPITVPGMRKIGPWARKSRVSSSLSTA